MRFVNSSYINLYFLCFKLKQALHITIFPSVRESARTLGAGCPTQHLSSVGCGKSVIYRILPAKIYTNKIKTKYQQVFFLFLQAILLLSGQLIYILP